MIEKTGIVLRKIVNSILFLLILFSACLMLKLTIPYFSFRYDVDFLLTKQAILHKVLWRWSFYIHISSCIFVLVFGLFQFIKPLLNRFPQIHRNLGKAYILIILAFSAPSGLVMAFYANGGFWAKASFLIISVLWWLFTFIAYRKIRKKKIKLHIDYMLRSYALTLSAITLRTYVFLMPSFIHLSAKDKYALVAWSSWIPNLILAEVLIKLKVFK